MKISKYISYAEVVRSAKAAQLNIDNTPTPEHLENAKALAINVIDPVREHIGGPIYPSSFYRSVKLNTSLSKGNTGVSPTSQHMTGEAVDLTTKVYKVGTNKQIFDFIRLNLDFDQLIWEYGTDAEPDWVHVSYKRNGKNRKRILRALGTVKKTNFVNWVQK